MKIYLSKSDFKYFLNDTGIMAVSLDYEITPKDNFVRWCTEDDIKYLLKDTEINREDRDILERAGWAFAAADYIFIPDDYDGCMACGYNSIRKVLAGVKKRMNNA